jgi:hypothetical protein
LNELKNKRAKVATIALCPKVLNKRWTMDVRSKFSHCIGVGPKNGRILQGSAADMDKNSENWPKDFDNLLGAIAAEKVPENLLQLALELQHALNAKHHIDAVEPHSAGRVAAAR